MRLKYYLTLGFSICLSACFAQFTHFEQEEKYISEKSGQYLYSTQVTPNFINGGPDFWYKYETAKGIRFYIVKGNTKNKVELFDRQKMAKQLSQLTGQSYIADSLPIQSIIYNKTSNGFYFRLGMKNFEYLIKDEKLSIQKQIYPNGLTQKSFEPNYRYSPDKELAVFSKDWNLFLIEDNKSIEEAQQLTFDGDRFFNYADREADTTSSLTLTGAKWLNSNFLYILRKDNRLTRRIPIVTSLSPVPDLRQYFYSLPGDSLVPQYQLLIIDAKTKKVSKVDIAKWKDQSVEICHVTKDGEQIYFQRKNRLKNQIEICKLTVSTKQVKVIISETSKPYLNEQLYYLGFLQDGKELLWTSERTGWNHLYLYSNDGRKIKPITKGNWVTGNVLRIDSTKRTIYFEGYGKEKNCNPYYSMIYSVELDGSNLSLLTPEFAMHRVFFDTKYNWFVDNFSRADLTPSSNLRSIKGKLIAKLEEADLTKLFASGWKFPETFSVKAADSLTELFGVMWKPNNFDKNLRYPIISHPYPGPQTEELNLEFSVDGNFNASLAQAGAVVITMGHRGGSPQRSRAYHSYGYGNLRDFAIADDYHGIQQLSHRFSYLDTSRVGIFGHSAGGAMAFTAMCTYTDFYRVGVSASGNHDNNIYNLWWGESHQGITQDSLSGRFSFQVKTNLELVPKLIGNLMLVTGDADENVHPAQTLKLADELIRSGKSFELVMLPGQPHIYFGDYKLFFERKMWNWFQQYLIDKKP